MEPEPGPGDRLSGCRLEAKLGHGGMGTVWSARRDDGHLVVVKVLPPEHVRDPRWRARLALEGRIAHGVVHRNVVRVDSVDVDGPVPHLVMEFVPGEDLAERLDEEGALPPREAAHLARDVALGLAAAHAQGVVHGDVKPGNVRVTPEGQVKLLDFGLARTIDHPEHGPVAGTPQYMAPEQWGDRDVDAHADIYSLGATLYHLATGAAPFRGADVAEVRRKVLAGDVPPPRALAPQVPAELERIIVRMMARDPGQRYPTASAAAADLDAMLSEP